MNVAIVTVSDTRVAENDTSGDTLQSLLTAEGFKVLERSIVKDDRKAITQILTTLSSRRDISMVVTTGGTGISPRDVTPDATRDVVDIEIPGISEAIRRGTAAKTVTSMLSRGIAGVANATLIINLPGSTKGVEECFEVLCPILSHAIKQISGDADHA